MADFIATTVCQPAILKNVAAVEKIMASYHFEAEVFIHKNLLYVQGYEWFCAYKRSQSAPGSAEVDSDNDATNAFLKEVQPYIEDELIIQMVGHEKCRYISAAQVTVTTDKVTWRVLDGDDYGVLRRLKTWRQKLHEFAGDPEMTRTAAQVNDLLWQETELQDLVAAAKAVGAMALLLKMADFLNLDVSDYRPYSGLLE